MKNNTSYRDFKNMLAEVVKQQKINKKNTKNFQREKNRINFVLSNQLTFATKDVINFFLSAIAAHKQARKYYGRLKSVERLTEKLTTKAVEKLTEKLTKGLK